MTPSIFDNVRADMRAISGPLLDLSQVDNGDEFVVIRGIPPAGARTPLHSHGDRETMVVISGTMKVWMDGCWRDYGPGQIVDIASDVPHALRIADVGDVSMVLVTTRRMTRFFEEVSTDQQDPNTPHEQDARFKAAVARYGYWTGSPEEQVAIGINVGNHG